MKKENTVADCVAKLKLDERSEKIFYEQIG